MQYAACAQFKGSHNLERILFPHKHDKANKISQSPSHNRIGFLPKIESLPLIDFNKSSNDFPNSNVKYPFKPKHIITALKKTLRISDITFEGSYHKKVPESSLMGESLNNTLIQDSKDNIPAQGVKKHKMLDSLSMSSPIQRNPIKLLEGDVITRTLQTKKLHDSSFSYFPKPLIIKNRQ